MTPNEEHLKKFYKIMGKKDVKRHSDWSDDDYIETLYLCKWVDDECYLIIGDGLYEYAELKMNLFDDKKAKAVFDLFE